MTRGRPKADLVIMDDERTQLTSFAKSRLTTGRLSTPANSRQIRGRESGIWVNDFVGRCNAEVCSTNRLAFRGSAGS